MALYEKELDASKNRNLAIKVNIPDFYKSIQEVKDWKGRYCFEMTRFEEKKRKNK